ncbi:hypothetical protein MIND_00017100 [Mycena indigotica]|uniref:HNH nuclease domain-containing protein n=1 Tax=Mycena indigotica TaxID=2126181 RepID=A0A8H6WDU1_9AGAR|nr:uncharacterized protein MIND_00017100 [Mycena indigotica]KAF7315029.1 hypothetical protein MIND_00017100 [Mycena indigotica]
MLPPLSEIELDHEGKDLWEFILRAEAYAEADAFSTGSKFKDKLIGVRVIGYFLVDFFSHTHFTYGTHPYKRLIAEITSCRCKDSALEDLCNLGLLYRNHLLRIFHSDARPVYNDPNSPSLPSFELKRQRILALQTSTKDSDVRDRALLRDGFRCKLTGCYDIVATVTYPELEARRLTDNEGAGVVQCAHIFSQSSDNQEAYSASADAILELFCVGHEQWVGTRLGVHRDANLLCMDGNLYSLFNEMLVWLEEVNDQARTSLPPV